VNISVDLLKQFYLKKTKYLIPLEFIKMTSQFVHGNVPDRNVKEQ